jgi:hypothetical protein
MFNAVVRILNRLTFEEYGVLQKLITYNSILKFPVLLKEFFCQ